MNYYGLPQLIEIMNMYFDNKFNKLQENNKKIELSNKEVIKYEEQIIEVHKNQRLIIKIV